MIYMCVCVYVSHEMNQKWQCIIIINKHNQPNFDKTPHHTTPHHITSHHTNITSLKNNNNNYTTPHHTTSHHITHPVEHSLPGGSVQWCGVHFIDIYYIIHSTLLTYDLSARIMRISFLRRDASLSLFFRSL
mgnify:CR=1 FL=1